MAFQAIALDDTNEAPDRKFTFEFDPLSLVSTGWFIESWMTEVPQQLKFKGTFNNPGTSSGGGGGGSIKWQMDSMFTVTFGPGYLVSGSVDVMLVFWCLAAGILLIIVSLIMCCCCCCACCPLAKKRSGKKRRRLYPAHDSNIVDLPPPV